MTKQKQSPTEDELEVVFAAWALPEGKGYVPKPEYLPAAEAMRAKGWLASWMLDNGDTAYKFTEAGETALKLSGLMRNRAAETN